MRHDRGPELSLVRTKAQLDGFRGTKVVVVALAPKHVHTIQLPLLRASTAT